MERLDIGLLGELHVQQKLVEYGWHPVRLDTASMAANADLIAVKKERRVMIQVKTTRSVGHSHANSVGFGFSTGYLGNNHPIFNSKASPLIADAVIAVSYSPQESRFFVIPVAFAEMLCRLHCDYWVSIPTRQGEMRSKSFPIYLQFSPSGTTHRDHHDRIQRNLVAFEDRWDVLDSPVENLHDDSAWPLQD